MRTEGDFIHINDKLLPLSFLYGLGVRLRNALFNLGILHQRAFAIPVISVGNITVGGSGKTPHTEYLVNLLHDKVRVAVLSRGYKRKTRGYILATDDMGAREIGDEPTQMKRKFHDVYVAVDKDRCHGIDRLTEDKETHDVGAIILDDAFQHRYVKPGINILLTDYHRLFIYDKLLPAGRLREPQSGKDRADMVIVTKCPHDLKPMEFRVLTKALNLYPYQELYFTTLEYSQPYQIFGEGKLELSELAQCHVLLLSGIASPRQMLDDITPRCQGVETETFGDHHRFTARDIERINSHYANMPKGSLVITTEKDAARLLQVEGLNEELRRRLYVLPVHIKFMLDQEENFNNKIISYVRKNSRNSILAKSKDDYKPKDSDHTGNRPRTISFRDN